MNMLIRQIAVLSVLWALCEMILPDGKYQQMVCMTASLLVMTALMSTISGWLGKAQPSQPVMSLRLQQAAEDSYQRTALTAMANQLERYCVQWANRAGYQASAAVWMTMDGALDHIQLTIGQPQAPLISAAELAQTLAQQLGVEEDRISMEEI